MQAMCSRLRSWGLSVSFTAHMSYLCSHTTFAPNRKGQAKGAETGRLDGTELDNALNRKLNQQDVGKVSALTQRRLKLFDWIMRTLPEFEGFIFEKTQHKVIFNGISSIVDVVLVNPTTNQRIYIEVKCTNYYLVAYTENYNNRCTNHPILNNGLPNTEQNRHALQAALPSFADPNGKSYVLIFTCDSHAIYPTTQVKAEFYDPTWYLNAFSICMKKKSFVDIGLDDYIALKITRKRYALLHRNQIHRTEPKRIAASAYRARPNFPLEDKTMLKDYACMVLTKKFKCKVVMKRGVFI